MQQELKKQCLQFCKHIETITNTNCVLMDIGEQKFEGEPFSHSCDINGTHCDAFNTHLYGTYEAGRWGNKYIYYCPNGFIFISIPVQVPNAAIQYAFIIGPIIMSNFQDEGNMTTSFSSEVMAKIPSMTTAQTRAFSEVIHAACEHIAGGQVQPDVDSGSHAEMLQMMYDLSKKIPDDDIKSYPIQSERQLQQMIRECDKENAQSLINELLGYVYFHSGANFKVIKSRVVELLILMSRAAIDGGGDIKQIFWLNDNYTAEIEKFSDLESLSRWLGSMMHKFISCVFDLSDVKHKDIMFKIAEYVKMNLAEKPTVDGAAEYVYLSKSHLSRILKQEMGCTFTEYVNKQRVERSKVLLADSRLTLADIAVDIGFDDQSYYTKVFKKVTGMTPGKYREQRR